MDEILCKNCATNFRGNFCPHCGQSAHEHRINASSIIHDIPHSVFHIDMGFFHTLIQLFKKPGLMLEEYISGKRVPYFRPMAYVVLLSAVSTILMKGISYASKTLFLKYNPNGIFPETSGFFSHYISVFIFLTIPITAFVTWLFFVRKKINYWEHVVINTYIAAQMNLILILIKLVGFFTIAITHQLSGIDMTVFLCIFISGLLYLYGAGYGFLMRDMYKKKWQLVLTLVFMNFVLANVFMNLFTYAGISNPW